MTNWPEVLREIQGELLRCHQRVRGRQVLPDVLDVRLPEATFGRWAPVLGEVTAEVGEALMEWAAKRECKWYQGKGPRLQVVLAERPEAEISVSFSSKGRR